MHNRRHPEFLCLARFLASALRRRQGKQWQISASPRPRDLGWLVHSLCIMSSEQKQFTDEALLKQGANHPVRKNGEGRWHALLTAAGFLFLTFNSAMALYRSNGDVGDVSFVAFSYLVLVLLYCLLRQYERTAPESPHREHIKMAVWLLTAMLTAAFAYKVAAVMPFPAQVLVWVVAGATVLGGFYAFFLIGKGTKA